MSATFDGNPAFPVPVLSEHPSFYGMSLRDYFAAMALQGICASSPAIVNAEIAREAYQLADAMLKAREL